MIISSSTEDLASKRFYVFSIFMVWVDYSVFVIRTYYRGFMGKNCVICTILRIKFEDSSYLKKLSHFTRKIHDVSNYISEGPF